MAGAKQLMGVALAACLASVVFQVSSAASSHIVGDSSGWIIPSSSSFYTSWAAKETFKVGDFLVFNFMSGAHTVAEVKKSDYDSCTTTSPLSQLNNGPANISISSAGTHYYICTVPGHCLAGQKLSITASAATSTPSSPTAAPSSPTVAPTPKSTPTPSATPKSSPAMPTPSAGAPTPSAKAPTPVAASPTPSHSSSISMPPTSSATPPAAAPMSSMDSPMPSPETAPTPSSGAGPSASPPAVAGGPPAPSPPSEAPSSPPKSDSTVAGAGLVLPLLVIIGASLLY